MLSAGPEPFSLSGNSRTNHIKYCCMTIPGREPGEQFSYLRGAIERDSVTCLGGSVRKLSLHRRLRRLPEAPSWPGAFRGVPPGKAWLASHWARFSQNKGYGSALSCEIFHLLLDIAPVNMVVAPVVERGTSFTRIKWARSMKPSRSIRQVGSGFGVGCRFALVRQTNLDKLCGRMATWMRLPHRARFCYALTSRRHMQSRW